MKLLRSEEFGRRYRIDPTGLILWLNQSDVRSYGDSQAWKDISGFNNYMEQLTEGNQPIIDGSIELSGSCRIFDGLNHFMQQQEVDDNTGASWGLEVNCISLLDENSFFAPYGVDISPYSGIAGSNTPYVVVIFDSDLKCALGYLAEIGGGLTFESVKGLTGITKANPGVITFSSGHGYLDGALIKLSGLTQMTELNNKYVILWGKSGDTFKIVNTSSYGSAETTGGNCAQKVIDCPSNGCRIVADKNGGAEGWAHIEPGFASGNNTSFTFKIYKSDFNIVSNFSILLWCKPSDGRPSHDIFLISKSEGSGSGRLGYGFYYINFGRLMVLASDNGISYDYEMSDIVFSDGMQPWTHVATVYDALNSNVSIFTNGIDVSYFGDGISSNIFDTSAPLCVGDMPTQPLRKYVGSLAEIMIFSRILYPGEIQKIFNIDRARYGK